jgi:phosphoribosylamine--glycine ligase
MKVLIVGAGGREHALVWKISQSNKVDKIYCAPGNAGISELAQCVDIKVGDVTALADYAQENQIDLTVVGPEESLVNGIVDEFENRGLRIFGPNKACAEFENSKAFTKKFLEKYYIPTAKYAEFITAEDALDNIGIFGYPTVIKADGLAAGKGVIIAQNEEEAKQAIEEIMTQKKFGASGDKVVIEEFLTGTEASMLCFVDGESIVPMESARDYKNIYDGNKGPNTGGMGSYSPNELFDDTLKCLVDKFGL